jgi:MarR family transcriptional regulator for hemolysin
MNPRTSRLDSFKERAPLGYLIFDVAKLMRRRFEEEARSHGVTLPQWRALAQVAYADSISQVALAQAIDADQMTVSGVLDRLEKRGLITREADPSDSRAKLVRVTDTGLAIVETARAAGTAMYEAALVGVATDQTAIATAVLQQMRENLLGQSAETKE